MTGATGRRVVAVAGNQIVGPAHRGPTGRGHWSCRLRAARMPDGWELPCGASRKARPPWCRRAIRAGGADRTNSRVRPIIRGTKPTNARPAGTGCCCRVRGDVGVRHRRSHPSDPVLRHRRMRCAPFMDRDHWGSAGACRAAVVKAAPRRREDGARPKKNDAPAITGEGRGTKEGETGEIAGMRV